MVEVIPSVTLHRKKVIGGPDRDVKSKTPIEYIDSFLERFEKVLIMDMDGILRNRPNWSILRKLEGKEVWVDLGARYSDGIFEPFMMGAAKVVLSTTTLKRMGELEEAFKLSDNILFRIELEGEEMEIIGRGFDERPTDVIRDLRRLGLRDLIFSGEILRPKLSVMQVDRIVGLTSADDFEVYLPLPEGYDKHRLEGTSVEGEIIEAWEIGDDHPGSKDTRERV
jgi:hypothetical protein